MQSSEFYRMLIPSLRGAVIISSILWYVSIACGGVALFVPGGRPWAVIAFIAGVMFYLWSANLRKMNEAAYMISENPEVVYWAHPMGQHQPLSDDSIDDYTCPNPMLRRTFLRLHLRDGTQFEFGLPPAEMRRLVTWLRERNPSVRLGAYDNI